MHNEHTEFWAENGSRWSIKFKILFACTYVNISSFASVHTALKLVTIDTNNTYDTPRAACINMEPKYNSHVSYISLDSIYHILNEAESFSSIQHLLRLSINPENFMIKITSHWFSKTSYTNLVHILQTKFFETHIILIFHLSLMELGQHSLYSDCLWHGQPRGSEFRSWYGQDFSPIQIIQDQLRGPPSYAQRLYHLASFLPTFWPKFVFMCTICPAHLNLLHW
jgi:hypothetical protein